MVGNGKFTSNIVTGIALGIGASIALGAIKIIADMTGGIIPRPFVLAQAGTFNTLRPDATATEYSI